jgi:type II secretory pathway pseudopilin PulG
MKKLIAILLIAAGAAAALWATRAWSQRQLDQNVARFNSAADNLILSLQQYREFTGSYPTGNNASITKDLLGRGEKKVVILSARNHSEVNDKGEIVDPWGTPLQFYFSDTEVLIRSAGPNRIWEDTAVPFGDDLYRTAPKVK